MPSVNAFQTNWSAGELSPRLFGRVDVNKYTNGAERIENYIVQRYGGAKKRGGTEYIGTTNGGQFITRLVPFVYSVTQAYILEFTENKIRFYTNGGIVTSGTPIEVATPYLAGDLFELQFAQSADVLYITHPDFAPRTLSRNSATSFSLDIIEFEDGPYLKLNTTATTLTPADDGLLATVTVNSAGVTSGTQNIGGNGISNAYNVKATPEQQEDAPAEWTIEGFDGAAWVALDSRSSQTGWSRGETRFFEFQNKASFSNYRIVWTGNNGGLDSRFTIRLNEDGDTMSPFNLTASSTTGINDGSGFLPTDVNRMIRILGGDGKWRWLRIVTRTSSTVVTVRMYGQALPDLRPMINWQMGSWSGVSGGNGYPSCVGFYSGRLCFASTAAQPQTVWMSRVDDFTNFGVSDPLQDDDAIEATVLADSVNIINWIAEGTDLFLGTTESIRTIGATASSAAFSPTNIRQKRETNYGAGDVQPVRVGTTALYTGYYRKDIREIAYSFDSNGYISNDLSILSEHIPAYGVKQMAYQQTPESVVWMVTDAGGLAGMTYERDQEVIAFHTHLIAGTGVAVESVATIPGTGSDEVWLVVKRTINGVTKRYIERLSEGATNTSTLAAATFLDSYLTYSGASTTTISGLSHLEGQSVYVWSGTKQGPYTVTAGAITIGTAVTAAIVGLAYTSTLETLSPEAAARGGTAQTRLGRISEVFVRLDRSMNGTIGPADGIQELLDYTKSTDTEGDYGTGVDMFTGDVRVPISMAWERQKRLKIVHSEPTPFHVIGLITEIRVSG